MAQPLIKEEVHQLIDSLPDGATMDDLRYLLYVRSEIEKGRASSVHEATLSTDEVFAEFGLDDSDETALG